MSSSPAVDGAPPDALVEALQGLLQSTRQHPVQRVETHISWVLLDGEHAWKIKKPVRLGFLDFSRLDLRRRYCEEELRLNRRLAPSLYLDVVPVHGSIAAPRLGNGGGDGDGDRAAIEYVLRMRQFAAGSLFSERVADGKLEPDSVDRLATRLAAFQAAAPVAAADSPFGKAAGIRQATADVLLGIESQARAQRIDELRQWCEARAEALAPCFEARKTQGRVREGHGDLHLANLVVLDDDVTAFDCIEFDPAMRWIDVQCDICFITMDLKAHGRRDLAFRFLDRWLEASGDHAGLAVLRYYEVYRALVRALVAGIRSAQGGGAGAASEADGADGADGAGKPDYLGLAQGLIHEADPRLLITHGLSGSGKSFASAQLLELAGAIRLRSDVERKRLFGLGALDPSFEQAGDIYGRRATQRTYASLRESARAALQAGYPVIVDAAFLRARERDDFRSLARELQVPFAILHCRADAAVLRERVRARSERRDDASEADAAVLEAQLADHDALGEQERALAIEVDSAGPLELAAIRQHWLAAAIAPASRSTRDPGAGARDSL